MATKISIKHALKIVRNNNNYKLIDVFNVLAKISSQYKEEETGRYFFIIFSHTDSYYHLSKIIQQEAPYIKSRTTITSCLKTLVHMDILEYSHGLKGWIIKGMADMLTEGYIELRKIFFTKLFYDLNITEKKAIFYATYIMSTKGYKKLKQIIVNIKNLDSEWMQIFKSNNIYYIRKRIKNILGRFFKDLSEIKRKEELSKLADYIHKERKRKIKNMLDFKFYFIPNKIMNELLSQRKTDKEILLEYRNSDPAFFGFLVKVRNIQNDFIKKKFTDKIMIALLKYCKALDYMSQQHITYRIIRKLNDKDEIVSPDKYISKTVKTYLEEIYI